MKPTYTLHKLPQGYVLTSDEEIRDGDFIVAKDSIRPIKLDFILTKEMIDNSWRKVISQDFDFSSLSPEEQKKIGWFDVASFAYEEHTKNPDFIDLTSFMLGAKVTFQKAQELLSDRRFTLEEAKKIYYQGNKSGLGSENSMTFEQTIQSLSQPKSWEVEVEMETLYLEEDSMNYTHEQDDVSGSKDFPKFTKGKIKILRLIK